MANVKLLLKESVKNVGRVGDLVDVSAGYARNFLLPKDLAVHPTPSNVKKVEERKKEIEKQERDRREQQAVLIKTLSGVEVTLERRANEQGHLFGSVTATDIAKGPAGSGLQCRSVGSQSPRQTGSHRHVSGCDLIRGRSEDRNQGLGRSDARARLRSTLLVKLLPRHPRRRATSNALKARFD